MPEPVSISFDDNEIKAAISKLNAIGGNSILTMARAMDDAAEIVVSHMKAEHFFIGTGKGSGKKAEENVFTFKNPDGTPRFKVRTANLLNSIQSRGSKISGTRAFVEVRIGEKYAVDVEEGGPGRRAFPFVRPAVEQNKGQIMKRAKALFLDAVKRATGGPLEPT